MSFLKTWLLYYKCYKIACEYLMQTMKLFPVATYNTLHMEQRADVSRKISIFFQSAATNRIKAKYNGYPISV